MRHWLVLFFAVLLPLQFTWTAASAYCQHETTEQQAQHFGHHFHAHDGEATGVAGKLFADSDCAACHAAGTPVIISDADARAFVGSATLGAPLPAPRFSSALARAPDRPQWLRLV